MSERIETAPTAVSDVTEEMTEAIQSIVDGWYPEGRIDWTEVLDRLDGSQLEDGTYLDLGSNMFSPAIKFLKRSVSRG